MPGQPVTIPATLLIDLDASLAACDRQNAAGAVKVTEDLARYAHVIAATRPDVVIECGTWMGGSARWFAARGVDVISIDNQPTGQPAHDRVTWLVGSSDDASMLAHATTLASGRRTMVVLDSDHSATNVCAEILAYGPLVTPGCHLVVEDGIARWMSEDHHRHGSPLDAIEALLIDNPAWVRDEQTEAMFPVSMHPAGWWVKKETT